MTRGSVVVFRFPADKARPGIVVRSDLLSALPYLTLLPITTELREGIRFRMDIAPSEANGLREPSQVMVDWPQTGRVTQIGSVIGVIDDDLMRDITGRLGIVLGLTT